MDAMRSFGATTAAAALAETPPPLATTLPVPPVAGLAVKVVDSPTDVERLPGVPVVSDQVGVTATALPKASAPVAPNVWLAPDWTVAAGGESPSAASGPATIARVCVADTRPAELAVNVAVPARVSR